MNEMTLGKRIMQHRKRLGMTQEQLADRVGVSAQAVSKWENDLSCPDISLLPQLAEIFGITVDELLGKEPAGGTVRTAEPVGQSPRESRKEVHMEWKPREGIWFAVYILCIGGLLLLSALRPELGVSWWTVLWTTALLIGGLAGMVHHPSFFPLAVTLAGAYFLVTSFGLWKVSLGWKVVIPAFLLLWGVSLLIDVLFGRKRKHSVIHAPESSSEYSFEDGWVKVESEFGEDTILVELTELRGGEIETKFGSYCVDFSGCESVAPDCHITVRSRFGETVLRIPRRFRVEMESSGGTFAAEAHTVGQPQETPEATIVFHPQVSFGELRVEYI